MEYLIAIVGFVGGWFLVAGPIWQAALELRDEEIDQEGIEALRADLPKPSTVSNWWWLLPPIAIYLRQRAQREQRKAFNESLTPEQLKQTVSFLNKANGWIVVAVGAFLIAVKETWEGIETFHLPVWLFWVLVVVLPIACIGYAVYRSFVTMNALGDMPSREKREEWRKNNRRGRPSD
jgi:hypothetical protein